MNQNNKLTLKNNQRGEYLEQIVESLLRKKKLKVKRNILLENKTFYSQIDITYGLMKTRYVECKEYYKRNVPLKDISKFYAVLKLNKINPKKGEFYTNTNYCKRAIEFAKLNGIKLYDYNYLENELNHYNLKKELSKLNRLKKK